MLLNNNQFKKKLTIRLYQNLRSRKRIINHQNPSKQMKTMIHRYRLMQKNNNNKQNFRHRSLSFRFKVKKYIRLMI
jgi:hypothetical protein